MSLDFHLYGAGFGRKRASEDRGGVSGLGREVWVAWRDGGTDGYAEGCTDVQTEIPSVLLPGQWTFSPLWGSSEEALV